MSGIASHGKMKTYRPEVKFDGYLSANKEDRDVFQDELTYRLLLLIGRVYRRDTDEKLMLSITKESKKKSVVDTAS